MSNSDTSSEASDDCQIPVVDIAPYGDMILRMPGEKIFKVSSAVLCVASPVFRAMLGPATNFKEACSLREATSELYTLALDDDPDIFLIVLYAIHLQSNKVPRTLGYSKVNGIAVICDKYDCAAAVTPWVPLWATLTVESNHLWLFTAWVFELEDAFTSITKQIILGGYKYQGHLVVGKIELSHCLPELVVEKINHARRSTITSILEYLYSFLKRYEHGAGRKCRHETPSEQCDMMILGSMIHAFQSIEILPYRHEILYRQIDELKTDLEDIELYFLPSPKIKNLCEPDPQRLGFCLIHPFQICYIDESHESTCDPCPEIFAEVQRLVSEVKGLYISDFQSRK